MLFVALAPGATLDDDLRGRIVKSLRGELSPRHVPDTIEAVPVVPRTLSGKKLEVPVKRILMGAPADQAASVDSLANPRSLDYFVELAKELGPQPADSPGAHQAPLCFERRRGRLHRQAPPRHEASRAPDDLLHDLVGPAVDAGHARVGEARAIGYSSM